MSNNVKWTPSQENAINSRGNSLLVSAAAGSGKTAVLVERLMRRIIDDDVDITKFLIITYTKAAASELRNKISEALFKKIKQYPDNLRLRRQLALVGSARISTVHSFCSWVLRNYADDDAFPSDFRILEEAEGEVILSETLSSLIEEKYDEKSESFLALAKYMNDGRGDRLLFSSVSELFKKSRSHPYPEAWLRTKASEYNIDNIDNISKTIWGREMLTRALEIIDLSLRTISLFTKQIESDSEAYPLYADFLNEAYASIKSCRTDDWDTLLNRCESLKIGRLPSSRKLTDKTIPDRIGAIFKAIRGDISSISSILVADSATLLYEISAISPIVSELVSLAAELSDRFEKEKLRRGLLDYSDLEHLCINLLISEYDIENDIVTPSEVGFEVSKNFSEILLDEFQDSNIVQDIIFRAVSKNEENIVMVGDVKQSIYGFRLADPSIFVKKYKTFKRFEDAKKDEPKCVLLSQNFRSREEILDTANAFFSQTMTEQLGGIDYTPEHYLKPREDIPHLEDMQTEFCLVDRDPGEGRYDAEARFTALKIAELISSGFLVSDKDGNSRPCKYGDFAVLLRSTATNAPVYEREFKRLKIPFISPKPSALLEKSEVRAIVSLLSVIDNPTSDIPLLAALKSPLFAFSADDLCELRSEGSGSFLSCIESLAKKEGATSKKCESFLSLLRDLRSLARTTSASLLIWEIYNRTNALGMFGAMPYGSERQKNLLEFYRAAEEFEALGYSGLYRFISHLTALSENGGDIAAARESSGDAVKIMTMHKSKGLEFPIVFVGCAIKDFNTKDITSPVLIHSKLGIGLDFRDETTKIECSSLMKEAIKRRIVDEQKNEEMRLFYVALTRAREKMFITASVQNAKKRLLEVSQLHSIPELSKTNLARRNDALLWFLVPLLYSPAGASIFGYADIETIGDVSFPHLRAYVRPASEIVITDADLEEKAELPDDEELEIPSFSYAHTLATETPSKLTATGLGALIRTERKTEHRRFTRPEFLREKKLTPAERGTALHLAMQFADFDRFDDEEGAKAELSRLVEKKFLSKIQADAVSPSHLVDFISSDIGKELKAANIEREFKFSVLLPADELLGENDLKDEKILLQGVIDMFYEKDGEITIVDFKTDRRRPEGETLKRYTAQLHAYRRALFEMTGKTATRLILYLVAHGDYIEV